MALLRLIVVTLAACGQAGAQPSATSGLSVPAGWIAIPEIAMAVTTAAKGDGVSVEGAEAWGEPARGCYGVWLVLAGEGASAEQVLAGIAAQPVTTSNVVRPEGADGLVTLSFEAPAAAGPATAPGATMYRGRLRARIAAGKITTLACFANDREPATCEAACSSLLGGLP